MTSSCYSCQVIVTFRGMMMILPLLHCVLMLEAPLKLLDTSFMVKHFFITTLAKVWYGTTRFTRHSDLLDKYALLIDSLMTPLSIYDLRSINDSLKLLINDILPSATYAFSIESWRSMVQ